MKVALGIWIGPDEALNEAEIELAMRVIRRNPVAVDRVVVGNESILRGDVTVERLNDYIRDIRRELPRRIKVTTAEPWNVVAANPDLARHVDFLTVHMLPYWEGIPLLNAVGHIKDRMKVLEAQFPGVPLVIGEAGWPSEGRQRKGAAPSAANQAAFVREFLTAARANGWDYYVLEAYDQPWKAGEEGAVGAFWVCTRRTAPQRSSSRASCPPCPTGLGSQASRSSVTMISGCFCCGRIRTSPSRVSSSWRRSRAGSSRA